MDRGVEWRLGTGMYLLSASPQKQVRDSKPYISLFFFFLHPETVTTYLVISMDLIRHYTHKRTHVNAWHLEDYPLFPTY